MPWRPSEPGEVPTLGYLCLDWMTEYLARPEVDGYEPFVPTLEQAEFLLRFYELDPTTGQRKIRRGVLSRPRGWGKSPFTAGIACLEALGPVVPDGWDADGRPVGIPWARVRRPLVEIAAVSESQVDTNTWAPLIDMLSRGPVVDAYPGLEPMAGAVNLPYGRIQKRTAAAGSAKGAPAVFVVCDQALALDTPIPTPSGWTTMGALHNGDVIYGSEGPTRVTQAKPVSLEHDCFRVAFADGTSVVASEGHLWMTKVSASAAKPRIRTTGEMYRDGRRFRIPLAPAQEMPELPLAVPPYLLGLWLGDGTRGKCELTVSEVDLADTQRALLDDGVETWPRRYAPNGAQYGGSTPAVNLTFTRARGFAMVDRPEVAKAMQALPCYRDKHVPEDYLAGSIAQRTSLLQGLMDSDGSCAPTGGCVFVTTQQVLADAVVRLLRSLGQVTSGAKRVEDDRYTGGGKWLVLFTPRRGLVPFRLARKVGRVRQHSHGSEWLSITSIVPVERVPVRCIAVEAEDHLFSVGLGGHLTHNTEEWTPGNGGVNLFNKLKNNVIKRGGHLLESPNAFTPGQASVAESSSQAYVLMRSGKARIDAGLMYDHREAPPETDLTDGESLMRGLTVAYGDSADVARCAIHQPPCKRPGWVDLEHIKASIWDPDADPQVSRSDWLNQITHASDSWLSQPEWAACADAAITVADSDAVTLGFDGSRSRSDATTDATALVACRVSDGHTWLVEAWEQPDNWTRQMGPWRVPTEQVDARVRETLTRFNVVGFYADPAKWESYIAKWEAEFGAHLEVKSTRQNPIEWWMTGGRSGLIVRALEQFHGAVVDREMTHDGGSTLTRHVLNARRRPSRAGIQISKDHPDSPRKIDGAIAAVLAWQARLDALAAGVTGRDDDLDYMPFRVR